MIGAHLEMLHLRIASLACQGHNSVTKCICVGKVQLNQNSYGPHDQKLQWVGAYLSFGRRNWL